MTGQRQAAGHLLLADRTAVDQKGAKKMIEKINKQVAYQVAQILIPEHILDQMRTVINFGFSNEQIVKGIEKDIFGNDDDKQIFFAALDYMRETATATN